MKTMTAMPLALILAAGVVNVAAAQGKVVPASTKVAGEHAPMGVRAGSFLVIPKVDVEGSYNDNIYATSTNEESDYVTTVRPEIAVKSNWNRHALNAVARAEANRYKDNGAENTDNHMVAVDGRVDVMRDTSIGGGISFARDHEDRGNPNATATSVEPTAFETTTAKIGAYRGQGKLNARLDSEVKKLDYKNNRTLAGAAIDNSFRDRNEYTQSLRLGYQFDDRFEGFVKGSMDTRAYDRKGSTPRNRSNHGKSLVAGAAFDLTGKTKGEAYAGVTRRDYVDNGFKDISEPTFGGKVTWNVSDLTSVIASADRTIEETTSGASSGFVSTAYNTRVEHALTRDVVLNGRVGFAKNDYKGTAANQRKDDIVTAGVGADYYFAKNFKAGADYTYTDRDSNATASDYSRNAVMLRLTATY